MKTLRYRSRDQEVYFLEELLQKMGYEIYVSTYFGVDTDKAVKNFQQKNDLVVDGIVGLKTWSKLLAQENQIFDSNSKLLSEQDLIDFAQRYDLELAAVKAVNEIESNGKGFLVGDKPRILFEGHIFWRQLEAKGIDPKNYVSEDSANVLYKKWTRIFYVGGLGEYDRMNKAAALDDHPDFKASAQASASWGMFQIMGYHFKSLGYTSVDAFVEKMFEHEREHLAAFGKFLEVNKLLKHLRSKNWAAFARGYNGPGYAANKYDIKLAKAYAKYS